jgi:hypothetical protein
LSKLNRRRPLYSTIFHHFKELRPLEENVPRNTLLLRFGRAVLDAAPEAEAGHGNLARYGSLDAAVVFIARRLGA